MRDDLIKFAGISPSGGEASIQGGTCKELAEANGKTDTYYDNQPGN